MWDHCEYNVTHWTQKPSMIYLYALTPSVVALVGKGIVRSNLVCPSRVESSCTMSVLVVVVGVAVAPATTGAFAPVLVERAWVRCVEVVGGVGDLDFLAERVGGVESPRSRPNASSRTISVEKTRLYKSILACRCCKFGVMGCE